MSATNATKRDSFLRAKLFRSNGRPKQGLANAFSVFNCATLTELESRVDSGDVFPADLYRVRGCGSHESPGTLAQYLFGVPSGASVRADRIACQFGHGAGI